jgi:GTP1/Obg family GTP-binding protein
VISRKELIKKIKSPYVRKRSAYENMLKIFDKYYEELDNSFIVFKKELAEEILKRLPSIQELEGFIEELANCLRGEKCMLLELKYA